MQRLAAGLINGCHGLGHGHAGAICDAITAAGIDPTAWTVRQITTALNTDMAATGFTWPDQISCPAAFLASRLKRIDWTPPPVNDGGYAAGLDTKPAPAPADATSTHQQTEQQNRHTRLAAQVAARAEHAHARAVAQAALGGPGHTAARTALAAALTTHRRTTAPPTAPGAGITAPPPPTYVPYRYVNNVTSCVDATERND